MRWAASYGGKRGLEKETDQNNPAGPRCVTVPDGKNQEISRMEVLPETNQVPRKIQRIPQLYASAVWRCAANLISDTQADWGLDEHEGEDISEASPGESME